MVRLFLFCIMTIAVGDIVSFLNEAGTGQVIQIKGDQAEVLMDHGFEEWYALNELVPRKPLDIGAVQPKDRPANALQKGQAKAHLPSELVVDLHFETLVQYPKNYQAFEKLNIQLNEARKNLEKARRSGIKRVILIHGVGQGRLKEEVHSMLERMDGLQFYDASYARFGRGATEVELR